MVTRGPGLSERKKRERERESERDDNVIQQGAQLAPACGPDQLITSTKSANKIIGQI